MPLLYSGMMAPRRGAQRSPPPRLRRFAAARRLVDRVHQLALDDAVPRAGGGLGAAEDGVDEVVVGRLVRAADGRVLHPLAVGADDVDPRRAPAAGVQLDMGALE